MPSCGTTNLRGNKSTSHIPWRAFIVYSLQIYIHRACHGPYRGKILKCCSQDFVIFTDPDDPFKLTDETRQLGLAVCRGTAVVLICPVDGMEPIANPFLQQEWTFCQHLKNIFAWYPKNLLFTHLLWDNFFLLSFLGKMWSSKKVQ